MRRALRRLLTVLASLAALLLLAELAASFTKQGNAALFVEDEALGIVRRPDTDGYTWGKGRWISCRINKHGLRGENLPEPRPSGERWVLCIGDSFTFGGGLETEQAWPQQMQALLGEPAQSGVRVLNGGANGWDTKWQRLYIERRALDSMHPDVVVLGWNWNDLNINPHQDAAQQSIRYFIAAEGTWLSLFADWPSLRSTHLYRWLFVQRTGNSRGPTEAEIKNSYRQYKATMAKLVVEPELKLAAARRNRFGDGPPDMAFWEATDTAVWTVVRAEMARLQELCAGRGVAFVVAMLPEPTWEGPGTLPAVDRLAALLDALGVPWIDLQPDMLGRNADGAPAGRQADLWQADDPVHPTPKGQRILADGVARLLREQGLVGPAAP